MLMNMHSSKGGKYTLRAKSVLKRLESERSRHEIKRKEPKDKPKPPPLSKYRRKTANARERNRMREINEAFITLQKTLPDLPGADADKLTKITVLKLAVNYIKILSCVVDGDVFVPNDIDGLREMWCMKNAHMARPEHCVRAVMRPVQETKQELTNSVVYNSKNKLQRNKGCTSLKIYEAMRDNSVVKKKKTSRAKGKVFKTASVPTSNGAYITLKNVAQQSSGRRPCYDNKPLMISMTVKRQRMEPLAYQRPPKIFRYEPPVVPKPKIEHYKRNGSSLTNRYSSNKNTMTASLSPLTCISTNSKNQSYVDNSINNFSLYDLDSPTFLKNDIFLELHFPRCKSSSSAADSSSFVSSAPSSPNSVVSLPLSSLEKDASSLNYPISISHTISSPLFSSSDNDSILTANPDLDSLLGSDPFEDDLDHLASSFVDSDDTLSLFLDHTSPSFMTSDINSY